MPNTLPPIPPSHPAPYRHLGTGSQDRSVRVQMVIALVAGLVMVAVPLYLWRRPASSHDDKHAAADAPSASSGLSALAVPSGGLPSAAQVDPPQPKGVTLGEAKIAKCTKPGSGKTPPEQCDRQPFFEEALVKAIRDNVSCAPALTTGGTISYVLDVDYKKKKARAWAGKSSSVKKKQSKEVVGCVNRALPTPDWSQIPHQATKYLVQVVATYPANSGAGGPLGILAVKLRASPLRETARAMVSSGNRSLRAALALVVSAFAVPACFTHSSGDSGSSVATTSASIAITPPSSGSSAMAITSASASASASASGYPGRTDGCPDGMVRVDGEYCPLVNEICKKHHKEWEDNHDVSERCLVFEEPTKCLSKERAHLSFCVDRWEYPNQVGELPRVLTSWREAVKRCEAEGKRLCTEDEFNFACEGPEMLPHVYGFVRDDTHCNMDKPYRKREKKLKTYDACLKDPACKEHFEMLDQRHKIGEDTECVSWAGVYDLNGNVNEWVNLPKEEIPNRSGLKGGWWGPVRNRCRPTVTFHKEEDFGYEAGFRCCKDAEK